MPNSSPSSIDRTGHVVSGRFRLDKIVGRGGQSVIYRARDLRDGDDVAIKVLNDSVARDSEWVERMFREAEAMTHLRGTAAVRVLGQTWTQDGAMGIVMELLDGIDLDDYLAAMEARGEKLSPNALLEVLAPIAQTLDAAHERGIVHRDLKPSNIFLLSPALEGGVRLLDFGFAKFVRRRGPTAHGIIAGSPSYIAPEAWREGSSGLDHRVDIYAFGAVVFRMLGGRPPFDASDLLSMVREVTQGARPSLKRLRDDLPDAIDAWIEQSLAIDPNARFFKVRGQFAALDFVLSS